MTLRSIVVVGAGVAGLTAVRTLRDEGFAGEVVLLGDEPHVPYARPPLSKEALKRGPAIDDVALPPLDELQRRNVTLRLGVRALSLDVDRRRVATSSGALDYDALVIATGARARVPAWARPHPGYHVLRSLDDARRLHAALSEAADVLIIGAGFLGTELAASARALGRAVTLVDVQPSPMHEQVGAMVSRRLAALHQHHGVTLLCGEGVERLIADAERTIGAQCAGGRVCHAGVVIVAAGAESDLDWLQGSGLDLADGIACDAFCAAAPGVFAAGDVANWPSARFGRRLRLEHQMNAVEQAAVAARNVLGAAERYDPLPYFWSDQYDVKIQVHGLVESGSTTRVLHGDAGASSFVVGYFDRADVLRGVLGWNAARDVRRLRADVGRTLTDIEASRMTPLPS